MNYRGNGCRKKFCHSPSTSGTKRFETKPDDGNIPETRRTPQEMSRTPITDNQTEETMRKIEEAMNRSLVQGRDFKRDNTRVEWVRHENGDLHSASIYLHGHKVGWYYWSGEENSWMLLLDDCQYQTVTTKSRLNALLTGIGKGNRLSIFQRDYQWYYDMGATTYKWGGSHRFLAMPPAGYTDERRTA